MTHRRQANRQQASKQQICHPVHTHCPSPIIRCTFGKAQCDTHSVIKKQIRRGRRKTGLSAPVAVFHSNSPSRIRARAMALRVVLDTNGLLEGASEARKGATEIWTTQNAEREVKDQRGKEQLAALRQSLAPIGGLRVSEPDEENAKAVWRFAKMTGDAMELSAADVSLLALVRRLHVLAHGQESLRRRPPPANIRNGPRTAGMKPMPGWDYLPNPEAWPEEERGKESGETAQDARARGEEPPKEQAATTDAGVKSETPRGEAERRSEGEAEHQLADVGGEEAEGEWTVKRGRKGKKDRRQRRKVPPEPLPMEPALRATVGRAGMEEGEEEGISLVHEPEAMLVTGDFAMQNVAVQMGMAVAAPQTGLRIKEARRWVRWCHACGAEAKDAERHFCGFCGNATLVRCAVKATSEGTEYFTPGRGKHTRLAGTRYSLPKPEGGREHEMRKQVPVLREDELKKRETKGKKSGTPDPFVPEFGINLFAREGKPRSWAADNARSRPLVGFEGNPNRPRRPRNER